MIIVLNSSYFKGIFKCRENTEDLKICLNELLNEIKLFNQTKINEKDFRIKILFSADLKLLHCIFGLNGPNSHFSCFYCFNNFENKINKSTNIEELKIVRNQKDAKILYKHKTLNERKGHSNEPIIDFIEYNDVIIDKLHMVLRITDQFFNALIKKIIASDGISSVSTDLEKRPLFKRLVDCFKQTVTNPFYASKNNSSDYKLRNLNQNERLKILEKLNKLKIENLFPEIDRNYAINFTKVIERFLEVINKLSNNSINEEDFKKQQEWLRDYLKLRPSETHEITPYIHIFVFHLKELIKRHTNLNIYNCQGLEKLNEFTTKMYFSSTNKNNFSNDFLKQIILKRNRLELYFLKANENELLKRN